MSVPAQDGGLLIVHTGNGKGKTTAALGLVLRACGLGQRACVVQFIKSPDTVRGEEAVARSLGVAWHVVGDGFTWRSDDPEATAQRGRDGWVLAREAISSGAYRLVVLDEFTYPLRYGWLDADEVVDWLVRQRPPSVHVVVTGRDAHPALLAGADLVTEMREVRHPYHRGVAAQAGIEF
ncbi:MAG: cob(I)yrinic acid a,c-diamide adenosyltransferase [Candidatus Limnocylindrales bacterium]